MADLKQLTNYSENAPQKLKAELEKHFIQEYGSSQNQIMFFRSPARINIIGEHIDYNGGLVFPTAIDKYIYLAIRKRQDSIIHYNDLRFPGLWTFDIGQNFTFKPENGYCNYLNGIITILKNHGHHFETGFDALFFSCIPDGGGVSSSSALECCLISALNGLYQLGITPQENAKIGQETEHRFMNVKCGIMDQFIIANGKKDRAILLDCATLEYKYIPLQLGEYKFIVMNTNKKRKLSESKYNERVSECKEGLEKLNEKLTSMNMETAKNPCSITENQLEILKPAVSETIYKRIRHCITENQRVKNAAQAMQDGNLKELGRLMNESHYSLRNDYETTGIELDTLQEAATALPECLGARVTGAGFGGCAIALVHQNSCQKFTEKVAAEYLKKIGYDASFFVCGTGTGSGEF